MTSLLTPAQVAQRLGLSRSTVYEWISDGRIPVVRLSARAVRVRESDLERLVKRTTRKAVQ